MCAFGAHNIKEVSRAQLVSAAKFFLDSETKKSLTKADKIQYARPLAAALLHNKIVVVQKGADIKDLSRDQVTKEATF